MCTSVQLPDSSQVDILGVRYKPVNFGADKSQAHQIGEPESTETALLLSHKSVNKVVMQKSILTHIGQLTLHIINSKG